MKNFYVPKSPNNTVLEEYDNELIEKFDRGLEDLKEGNVKQVR